MTKPITRAEWHARAMRFWADGGWMRNPVPPPPPPPNLADAAGFYGRWFGARQELRRGRGRLWHARQAIKRAMRRTFQ